MYSYNQHPIPVSVKHESGVINLQILHHGNLVLCFFRNLKTKIIGDGVVIKKLIIWGIHNVYHDCFALGFLGHYCLVAQWTREAAVSCCLRSMSTYW